MKILFFLITLLFCQMVAFGQKVINAKEAKSHVGETVILLDTIRSGMVYQDSTAIIKLGKNDKTGVSVILISKGTGYSLDFKVINTLRAGKASFKGTVLPLNSGFVVIINDPKSIHFNYLGIM